MPAPPARSLELEIRWPLTLTRFDGNQTVPELVHYIDRFDREVHARREPYVGIAYLRRYNRDRETIALMQQWLKRTEEVTRRYCLGVAMISPSAGFRFVLSAIFVVQPMPCPYEVCSSYAEAVRFVTGAASRGGLRALPPPCPWPELVPAR
jgi:hypothetical protein